MCHIALGEKVYYTKDIEFGSMLYTKEKDESNDRSEKGTKDTSRKN